MSLVKISNTTLRESKRKAQKILGERGVDFYRLIDEQALPENRPSGRSSIGVEAVKRLVECNITLQDAVYETILPKLSELGEGNTYSANEAAVAYSLRAASGSALKEYENYERFMKRDVIDILEKIGIKEPEFSLEKNIDAQTKTTAFDFKEGIKGGFHPLMERLKEELPASRLEDIDLSEYEIPQLFITKKITSGYYNSAKKVLDKLDHPFINYLNSINLQTNGTTLEGINIVNLGKKDKTEFDRVEWTDVIGQETAKLKCEVLIEYLSTFNRETGESIFETVYKIKAPTDVLFFGPPGVGKTMLTKATATRTEDILRKMSEKFGNIEGMPEDVYVMEISGEEKSKYWGETTKNIREKFKIAEENTPSIIFMDELEGLTPNRAGLTSEAPKELVTDLCKILDGMKKLKGVVTIGATNDPNDLDPAILNRLAYQVPFRKPKTEEETKKIYNVHLRDLGDNILIEDDEWNKILSMSFNPEDSLEKNYTNSSKAHLCGRDIKNICDRLIDVFLERKKHLLSTEKTVEFYWTKRDELKEMVHENKLTGEDLAKVVEEFISERESRKSYDFEGGVSNVIA